MRKVERVVTDRRSLSPQELEILDGQIIPAARRWLSNPILARHGAETLAFWGEPLIDSNGKPYGGAA